MEYSTFSFFQIDYVNRTNKTLGIVQHRYDSIFIHISLLLMITFLLVSFNIKGRFSLFFITNGFLDIVYAKSLVKTFISTCVYIIMNSVHQMGLSFIFYYRCNWFVELRQKGLAVLVCFPHHI
ncbi:unnamed protein product [Brassica oleracea var. botrytis]|uniref:(rape) hypothetical protein n=1 Tax=Brassica napus TaxID=3708 RepID=A0A816IZ11_BRANA|nr:unnamed protein product [Brassica napus]